MVTVPLRCRLRAPGPEKFIWGGGGPPVLGNFDLLTPNLVHLWNSMSVIRWYMSLRDRVHSARAMHVHYVYAQAPLLSGNFELATQNLAY